VKRTRLGHGGTLRPGTPPARRTPLRRRTPLARQAPSRPQPADARRLAMPLASARRLPGAASEAQRAKIVGSACLVCGKTKGLTPAHLAPRGRGGCDHPDCVVPLCWLHHRAFDTGKLELLGYLEPRRRVEIAHAVGHLGLVGAYRRLTAGRWPFALASDGRAQ
jgi:hypothetical protein